MNNTQNIENLKNLVAKNIEAGGFLNSLRAQLKVEVYKIIESQDQRLKENVGFQWEHPLLNQIKGMTEGMKSLELILEYLEFFKFDYIINQKINILQQNSLKLYSYINKQSVQQLQFNNTAQVLRKEANFNDPVVKESLARKLGLNSSLDSLRPLLMVLVSEYSKGGSTINIQSPINNAAPPETNISRNQQQNKKQQEEEQKRRQEEELKKKELEEKKKLEEQQKKEQADSKKATKKEGKDRPQTAPTKPEQPAPNVNKIRGGQTKQNALTSMFGLDLGGNQNQFEEDDIFSNKPKQQQQPKPQQNTKVNNQIKNNAYEVAEPQAKNQKPQNAKGNATKQVSSDPYAFDLDEQPKQQQKKYDYDLNQTIGKKFNNPYAIGDPQKGQVQKGNKNDEIEEDIDDFQQSRDDRAKQSNQLFTSDDDYQRATQSLGVDESVDSLALEEYDYYEDVYRKR